MELKYETVLNSLLHIEKVYTIKDIFKMYEEGAYNAELLLQHSLINMAMLEILLKSPINET